MSLPYSRIVAPLFAALLVFSFVLQANGEEPTPQGPVIAETSLRGRILLNGVWKFQPAVGSAEKEPQADDWGTIRVPGSWMGPGSLPGVGKKGKSWGEVGPQIEKAWYERTIAIPGEWAGRSIVVDFRRISTDGDVFVNGQNCGPVRWPYGEVDISKAANAGKETTLRVLVTANADAGESLARMGYAVEKSAKNTLESAGIIGEVWLLSRPTGAHITDVFARPSVREKQIGLDVELSGIATAGEVDFTARMLDESGQEEIVFQAKTPVKAAALQTVNLKFPWEKPRLWDLGQPNLYRVVLEAKGAGLNDAALQRFGFRELWISGRDFFLNGVKIRWRPLGGHSTPATILEMDALVDGATKTGFNISQIWPSDNYARGQANAWELWAERASEKGWPIIAAATHFGRFMDGPDGKSIWASPEGRERYAQVIQAELRRYRNEPSVMMYGTTGNIMNHAADQNPRYIGQRAKSNATAGPMVRYEEALEVIRQADPLRPAFIHAGNRAGDVYSVNHYLNLIPLQEREEWLSDYAEHGDAPYIGIEFGVPFNTNMNRGRLNFGDAHKSEPQLTENTAAYLGAEAFRLEPRNYRRNIRFSFSGADWSGDWNTMQRLQSHPPAFQSMLSLFIRNTWRSWRTWGVTGGMIAWNQDNQLWSRVSQNKIPSAPWASGQRGAYLPEVSEANLSYLQEPAWKQLDGAKTLQEVNGPTLAWIAGKASAFTEKSHHFRDGEKVEKQIVLINDQRSAQPYTAKWTVDVGGKSLATKEETGTIEPGSNLFFPVGFTTPENLAAAADGKISLTAKIGERAHTDEFAFQILPAAVHPKITSPIVLFDPVGKTATTFKKLGIAFTPWNSKPVAGSLLVMGRESLSSRAPFSFELQGYVNAGGRVLVMTQTPDFLRESLGFRVSQFQTRRAFRVDPAHPIFAGLNDDNFRDWAGEGTLVESKPQYDAASQFNFPLYGWRWGSRHTVSSAAIEKPHLTGWRPLLECEFDLSYSPLMELDHGKGRVTLCTLDLEDQASADPAAEKVTRQLLNYAATAPLNPRAAKTIFVGSPASFESFSANGIVAENVATVPTLVSPNSLLVIGPDAKVASSQLSTLAKSGAKVLVLARHTEVDALLPGRQEHSFYQLESLPTGPVFAGISLSDLRMRSEVDWWLFNPGPGVEASGLFASQREGNGVIVYTQLDPGAIDVKKFPWARYTRWHQTRAVNQVLANMGATFAADTAIFHPSLNRMKLTNGWRIQLTAPLVLRDWRNKDTGYDDPGISPAGTAAVAEKFDDSKWPVATVPAWFPPLNEQSGEYVARQTVDIPAEWNGQVLRLGLGRIKSFDTAFWNGQPVGSTDKKTPDSWNVPRRYRVPANLVRTGKTVIAIRGFAADYQGGIHGSPDDLFLQRVSYEKKPAPLYHPDYKDDFDYGDNPFRYYRW